MTQHLILLKLGINIFFLYMFNKGSNTRADKKIKDLIDIDLKLDLHMHILNCNKNWVSKLLLEKEDEE